MKVVKSEPQFARIGEVYLKLAITHKNLANSFKESVSGPISDEIFREMVAQYQSSMEYFKSALQVSGQLSLNKHESKSV